MNDSRYTEPIKIHVYNKVTEIVMEVGVDGVVVGGGGTCIFEVMKYIWTQFGKIFCVLSQAERNARQIIFLQF